MISSAVSATGCVEELGFPTLGLKEGAEMEATEEEEEEEGTRPLLPLRVRLGMGEKRNDVALR